MTKIVSVLAFVLFTFVSGHALALDTASQLQVPVGRPFLDLGNDAGSMYIHNTIMGKLNGSPTFQDFLYFGPKLKLNADSYLYLLIGSWIAPNAVSFVGSVWYENNAFLHPKLSFFVEGDVYYQLDPVSGDRHHAGRAWRNVHHSAHSLSVVHLDRISHQICGLLFLQITNLYKYTNLQISL